MRAKDLAEAATDPTLPAAMGVNFPARIAQFVDLTIAGAFDVPRRMSRVLASIETLKK